VQEDCGNCVCVHIYACGENIIPVFTTGQDMWGQKAPKKKLSSQDDCARAERAHCLQGSWKVSSVNFAKC